MRSLHRSSHSVAFLCTDSRRAAHRIPHAYIASHPSVSFTSFAAHVKHHVLSESIPFPFGLYVCLPLSCLDVKCTLDMNPLSSPALLPSLPTQVPHRPIINAEPSLFCQSVGHLVVKLTLLRRWTIPSGWLLAESGIQTSRIDNVTPANGLRVRLHPGQKTIPYTFLLTRQDLFIGFRQS